MAATFVAPADEQVTCRKLRAKLALLEATFSDGSVWHLTDDSSQSFPTVGLATTSSSSSQSANWIDNSHSAPLLLIAKGNTLTVRNRADKMIESYQLGCLRMNHPLKVVHHFAIQKNILAPSTGTMIAWFDAPPDEQYLCQKHKAKLSVLQATFDDGSTWHLSDASPDSSPASNP